MRREVAPHPMRVQTPELRCLVDEFDIGLLGEKLKPLNQIPRWDVDRSRGIRHRVGHEGDRASERNDHGLQHEVLKHVPPLWRGSRVWPLWYRDEGGKEIPYFRRWLLSFALLSLLRSRITSDLSSCYRALSIGLGSMLALGQDDLIVRGVRADGKAVFEQTHERFKVGGSEFTAHLDGSNGGVVDLDLAHVVAVELCDRFCEGDVVKDQVTGAPTQVVVNDLGKRLLLHKHAIALRSRDASGRQHDDLAASR